MSSDSDVLIRQLKSAQDLWPQFYDARFRFQVDRKGVVRMVVCRSRPIVGSRHHRTVLYDSGLGFFSAVDLGPAKIIRRQFAYT